MEEEEEEEVEEEDAWCREKDACPVLGESGTLLAATADGSAPLASAGTDVGDPRSRIMERAA